VALAKFEVHVHPTRVSSQYSQSWFRCSLQPAACSRPQATLPTTVSAHMTPACCAGMDRPLSPLRDAGSLFRGDSLSSGSGSWSVTSSELGGEELGSSPGSARRHRRSGSGAKSPDDAPRCNAKVHLHQVLPMQRLPPHSALRHQVRHDLS
jgi:hypothetical protein